MSKTRYDNIDALRVLASISIIVMHVLYNGNYALGDNIIIKIIGDFPQYVKLFFMISGFGLCCGYYDRFKEKNISLTDFYSKRYIKILPFFALLIVCDLAVSLILEKNIPQSSLYEAFANLTLTFGFLPKGGFSVVGVGWTLGVIFGFYIIFPFFVFLLWNKKRAWISFFISILMTVACENYFLVNGRAVDSSMIRWLCYFIAGGLIFLYRDQISLLVKKSIVGYLMIIVGLAIVYLFPQSHTETPLDSFINNMKLIVGFAIVLSGTLMPKNKGLANPLTKFISSISFEIYLSHMLIFRVVEKMGLVHPLGNELASFILVSILVTLFTIIFATIYKAVEKNIVQKFKERKKYIQ